MAALADKIIGPLNPKCVNNISPKSSYNFFLPFVILIATFFKESPCNWVTQASFVSSGTKDGVIFTILCPLSSAKRYPAPVEPVL